MSHHMRPLSLPQDWSVQDCTEWGGARVESLLSMCEALGTSAGTTKTGGTGTWLVMR